MARFAPPAVKGRRTSLWIASPAVSSHSFFLYHPRILGRFAFCSWSTVGQEPLVFLQCSAEALISTLSVGRCVWLARRAWLPQMSGRLVKVKGKLHSWSGVSNTWNDSWQTGEIFTLCVCVHVLVRVWVCVKWGNWLWGSGLVGCYWAVDTMAVLTKWRDDRNRCACVCVCVCVKEYVKAQRNVEKWDRDTFLFCDLFLTCIYDKERELIGIGLV